MCRIFFFYFSNPDEYFFTSPFPPPFPLSDFPPCRAPFLLRALSTKARAADRKKSNPPSLIFFYIHSSIFCFQIRVKADLPNANLLCLSPSLSLTFHSSSPLTLPVTSTAPSPFLSTTSLWPGCSLLHHSLHSCPLSQPFHDPLHLLTSPLPLPADPDIKVTPSPTCHFFRQVLASQRRKTRLWTISHSTDHPPRFLLLLFSLCSRTEDSAKTPHL